MPVDNCPFCEPSDTEIVARNDSFYARYDRYPVNRGHILIIPFRHVADFFELAEEEVHEGFQLVFKVQKLLTVELRPDGFNIGVNVGKAAGQTVWHVHIHLIPRYTGDIPNPEGGVRGVIPEKRIYRRITD